MFKLLPIIMLGLPLLAQAQYSDTSKIATTQKFNEVLTFIDKLYVDKVDAKELTEAAIVAMLEKLDPHSTYISKDDVDDANEKINGSFVGIGIRYQMFKDTLNVLATIPGGPSAKGPHEPQSDPLSQVTAENHSTDESRRPVPHGAGRRRALDPHPVPPTKPQVARRDGSRREGAGR